MRHRMTLQNSRTGRVYELLLEGAANVWRGSWRTLANDGAQTDGPRGSESGSDASTLFGRAKRAIEDADPDVVGVDWAFEEPLPPWLSE